MAYKKINTMTEAISIGNKKGETKTVEGFLIGAKYGVGKKGKNRGNTLFQFQAANGDRFDVWGNASIIGSLTIDGKLNPAFVGNMVKIEFDHMRDAGKGKNPQKVCNVFLDDSKTIKKTLGKGKGTDYNISQ